MTMRTADPTRSRRRRLGQALAGLLLVAFGLSGLTTVTSLGPAIAQGQGGPPGEFDDADDAHEAMHEMMEAMHGEGAVERMHDVEGSEEMMDHCASMMGGMGGMDRDMMQDMMRGRGSGMMAR